jgi:hypothetical protein
MPDLISNTAIKEDTMSVLFLSKAKNTGPLIVIVDNTFVD